MTPKLEDAQNRMTAAQAASKEKRDAKAAVDQHVSDSRVRIGELEARLNAAKAEAGRLAESGCPAPDNATCKFLTSAVAAQAAIPELSVSLERMKMDDREKYETLMDAYRKSKEKDEALGDPAAEIMDISDEIKKHRAAADLASNLAAATAALAGIDASIAEAEKRRLTLRRRSRGLTPNWSLWPFPWQRAVRPQSASGKMRRWQKHWQRVRRRRPRRKPWPLSGKG